MAPDNRDSLTSSVLFWILLALAIWAVAAGILGALGVVLVILMRREPALPFIYPIY